MTVFGQSSYILWFASSAGTKIFPLDLALIDFQYVKKVNGIGWGKVTYGLGDFDVDSIRPDYQIQVWRKPPGSVASLDFLFFIREWTLKYNAGRYTITMEGPDQNDLLRRRIVAAFSGTEDAFVLAEEADNLMKKVVRESMSGSAADPTRDWSGNNLSVDFDKAAGPTMAKWFAWKPVLSILEDVNAKSRAQGNEVFFAMEEDGLSTNQVNPNYVFRTYINQPGADKTEGTSRQLVFSPEWGTLDNVEVKYDYMRERNFVYAAGQGEGVQRITAVASNNNLINNSIFGRIEAFKDARNEETADSVQDAADSLLSASQPKIFFKGDLKDVGGFRYGLDWFLGDKVTASIFGRKFDGIIRAVSVKLDADGREIVTAKLETEDIDI